MSKKRGLLVWGLLVLATILEQPRRWRGAREHRRARGSRRLLQRPRVQALWENANKRAHAAVIKVVQGKDLGRNGNVSTANGVVTLDLRPAITRLATRLGVEDKLKANADPNAGRAA